MRKGFGILLNLAIAATMLSVSGAYAQSASTSIDKPFVHPKWSGVWQAKLDDVPAVNLTLANDAGEVNGTIVFHAIKKENGKAFSFSTEPHTLIHPLIKDNILSFQVIRGNGSQEVLNMAVELREDGNIGFTCSNCGAEGSKADMERLQF